MLGTGEACWGKWLETTCELFPGTNLAAGLLATVLKTGEAVNVLWRSMYDGGNDDTVVWTEAKVSLLGVTYGRCGAVTFNCSDIGPLCCDEAIETTVVWTELAMAVTAMLGERLMTDATELVLFDNEWHSTTTGRQGSCLKVFSSHLSGRRSLGGKVVVTLVGDSERTFIDDPQLLVDTDESAVKGALAEHKVTSGEDVLLCISFDWGKGSLWLSIIKFAVHDSLLLFLDDMLCEIVDEVCTKVLLKETVAIVSFFSFIVLLSLSKTGIELSCLLSCSPSLQELHEPRTGWCIRFAWGVVWIITGPPQHPWGALLLRQSSLLAIFVSISIRDDWVDEPSDRRSSSVDSKMEIFCIISFWLLSRSSWENIIMKTNNQASKKVAKTQS